MLNNSSCSPPSNQSPRVLALDDEPQLCKLLFRCLTSSYDVACVTDTDAAITSIAEHCPDLIFVDVHLSCQHTNGVTFVWQLRDQKYTGIICMLSSDYTQEIVLSALIAGANEYLVKADIDETILFEVDFLLGTGQTNINKNDYVQKSGRLRSEGLSGNDSPQIISKALSIGADYYIIKGQASEYLNMMIGQLLKKQGRINTSNQTHKFDLMKDGALLRSMGLSDKKTTNTIRVHKSGFPRYRRLGLQLKYFSIDPEPPTNKNLKNRRKKTESNWLGY